MSTPAKGPRGRASKARQRTPVYQLQITLVDIEPPVWRRVRMPGNLPLGRIHEFLQETLGWRNSHLHRFTIAGRHLGPASQAYEMGDEDLLTLTQAVDLAGSSILQLNPMLPTIADPCLCRGWAGLSPGRLWRPGRLHGTTGSPERSGPPAARGTARMAQPGLWAEGDL